MLAMKTPVEMKISLMQISNMLLHKGFLKLLLNSEHRFEQFPFVSEVIENESVKLLTELKGCAKRVSTFGDFRQPVSLDDKSYIVNILSQTALAFDSLANSISPAILPKRTGRFVLSREDCFLEKARTLFGADLGLGFSFSISKATSGYEAIDNFNISALYYFLSSYLTLRATTSFDTNNPMAEGLINHVFLRGRDYVLNGHPSDLLAHDVLNLMQKNSSCVGIYLHDNALLTKAATIKSPAPEGAYSTYYDFSELSQTKFEVYG